MIPRIEQVGWPFRAVALGLFVGGIGRLISIQEFGVPSAPMYYGMMLELSMPIFVAWQYWVEKAAKDTPHDLKILRAYLKEKLLRNP